MLKAPAISINTQVTLVTLVAALLITSNACADSADVDPSKQSASSAAENARLSRSDTTANIPTKIGIGDLAPDFTLTKPDGSVITLSALREMAKPFILISFATW